MAGALVGDKVTGALVGDEVTGALVGEDVLELLFVLVDFPSELFADLVPTFAEAMERVAKIMMAAEENFMVVDDLGCRITIDEMVGFGCSL